MMIDFNKAQKIASAEIKRHQTNPRYNGMEFGETRFWREQTEFWTFAAPIPKLQDEGYAPGALLVSVDKTDGHIWTEADFAKLSKEKVNQPQPV
jgi:hypothetical protein